MENILHARELLKCIQTHFQKASLKFHSHVEMIFEKSDVRIYTFEVCFVHCIKLFPLVIITQFHSYNTDISAHADNYCKA